MRAGDVMSSPVVTVTPDTTVKDAAVLLASNGFTALPVVDDDERLIGMVTEADLVHDRFPRDARYRRPSADPDLPRAPTRTVGEVMTTPAIAMGAGTDIVDLVTAMAQDHDRCMPIVDGSRVIGIVTRRDLLRVLARADVDIAVDVRHQLANYGGTGRWIVEVRDGAVTITDELDDVTDRHVAMVLTEAVPGVTAAHVATTHERALRSSS